MLSHSPDAQSCMHNVFFILPSFFVLHLFCMVSLNFVVGFHCEWIVKWLAHVRTERLSGSTPM